MPINHNSRMNALNSFHEIPAELSFISSSPFVKEV